MSAVKKCLVLFALTAADILAFPHASAAAESNAGAVVLVNSQATDYQDFPDLLEPYLIHFGVPYRVADISQSGAKADFSTYSLIVIGHRGLDPARRFLTPEDEERIAAAVEGGSGLVSFDGLLASVRRREPVVFYPRLAGLYGVKFQPNQRAERIVIGGAEAPAHYITAQGKTPRTIQLKQPMPIPGIAASEGSYALATAGESALLVAATRGKGRAVLFASYEWVRPATKGKVYGLDDLIWRSLVWAARKPFVMRGMPNYLAFRVDDVAGFGIGANKHLGWVTAANRYGLKPWLGVFIEDMRQDPQATRLLAQVTQKGMATASVHAYRWPEFFFWDQPLLNDEHGRNIAGRPWSGAKMAANFREAEEFFRANGIPKSPLILPHFYEIAVNAFDGLKGWGAEFVCTILEPGKGYGTPVPRSGPYLKGEPARASNARDPIFIADWLKVPGRPELDRRYFNFVIEIRDDAGYEWAPSGVPVQEAIRRGVDQSRRAYDSLIPAVLFTHESDHIQKITPEDWDAILAGVMDGLKLYKPQSVTLDFLTQYMRAVHTSKLSAATFDTRRRKGAVDFEGAADVPVKFYVYEKHSDRPEARELEVKPFKGKARVEW